MKGWRIGAPSLVALVIGCGDIQQATEDGGGSQDGTSSGTSAAATSKGPGGSATASAGSGSGSASQGSATGDSGNDAATSMMVDGGTVDGGGTTGATDVGDAGSTTGSPTTGETSTTSMSTTSMSTTSMSTTSMSTTSMSTTSGGSTSSAGSSSGGTDCDTLFSGISGYLLCDETATNCKFSANTASMYSCNDICALVAGSTCEEQIDNPFGASCTEDNPAADGCDGNDTNSEICVCSKP